MNAAAPKSPPRPPTFLGGLKARLGDPTIGERIPLGSYALSILAVLMITLAWPLLMGGTIALAVALSGEDPHTNAPDDANGYEWHTAGLPQGATGSCMAPGLPAQVGNAPTPGTLVVTSATVGQFQGLRSGINYTSISSPGTGSTNTCGAWKTETTDLWVIGIPAGVLDPGTEDAISRLSFEVVGSSGCSTWAQCDDGIQFDEWRLEINGTAVVTKTGADALSRSCSRAGTGGSGFCTATVDFNITLTGLESADIADEMAACGAFCNASLHFENAAQVCDSAPCYQPISFSTSHRISIEVFSTNADTASLTMRASVWLLFGGTLALAIGATPLWDPLRRYVGDLNAPDIGGAAP